MYQQYKLAVLRIKLREAIDAYEDRTGKRMTYAHLSELTGVSRSTIESIASRRFYNATLDTVAKLCAALGCSPGELLQVVKDSPRRED